MEIETTPAQRATITRRIKRRAALWHKGRLSEAETVAAVRDEIERAKAAGLSFAAMLANLEAHARERRKTIRYARREVARLPQMRSYWGPRVAREAHALRSGRIARLEIAKAQDINPADPRAVWRKAYRIARAGKLAGKALYDALAVSFDHFAVCKLQWMIERGRAPDFPPRHERQRQVLNCFGAHSPFLAPAMDSPRFEGWRRTVGRVDALVARLEAAGRIERCAGNYVARVLPRRDTVAEWLAADAEVSAKHDRDEAMAKAAGDHRLVHMIGSRRAQWKEALAEALAA